MDATNLYALISVVVVSLISLIGLFTLSIKEYFTKKIVTFLVAFSAGALLGDVFIHLLPELAEKGFLNLETSLYILGAIILFFIIERYVHWHHHHSNIHNEDCDDHIKPVAYTILIGDGFHNLIDGLIIGGAFLLDIKLGIATAIAVILHEIPQEIGDFGVLIYSGFSKAKALFYNFISALAAIAGTIIALIIGASDKILAILAALAIGSFIYIATADLIPEIHRDKKRTFPHLLSFLLGIGIMALLLFVE
jgi:zinc and cadmium transporter